MEINLVVPKQVNFHIYQVSFAGKIDMCESGFLISSHGRNT